MFKHILVPLDGSPLAEEALGMAGSVARASNADISLAMVHEPHARRSRRDEREAMDRAHRYLESIAEEIWSGAHVPVTHGVLRGDAAEMVCARALDVDADLIVMTSHGRSGLSRAWLGSVTDGVIQRSTLPVLVVRPKDKDGARSAAWPPMRQILVPVDGSNLAAEVLSCATKLASNGASIVLLQIVRPVPMVTVDPAGGVVQIPVTDEAITQSLVTEAERHLAGLVRKLRDDGVTNAESHVVVAPRVAPAIVDFAHSHHADVIAMATHGRDFSRLIVGSVADKVRRSSDVPVLLWHPKRVSERLGFLSGKSIERQLPSLAGA